MRVFGFLGTNGSGKDFVKDYVAEKYGDFSITVSDIINKQLAKELGIRKPDRETKVKFSRSKTDRFGQDYWMKKTIEHIRRAKHNLVAVAGLRYPQDVRTFRKEFGEEFTAVWIRVSAKVRYARLVKRGRSDAPKSYGEFLRQDLTERKKFNLDKARGLCDYSLDNSGTPKESRAVIDKFMKKMKIATRR